MKFNFFFTYYWFNCYYNKFTYLGSNVSSTETDIDSRLAKTWTANDSLSVIWKSDMTDKMKRCFFQVAVVSILLYGCTTWTLTKRMTATTATWRQLHKNAASNIEQVLEAAPHKATAIRPPTTHHENVKFRWTWRADTAGEVGRSL